MLYTIPMKKSKVLRRNKKIVVVTELKTWYNIAIEGQL